MSNPERSVDRGINPKRLWAVLKRMREHEATWERPWESNSDSDGLTLEGLERVMKNSREHEATWERPWESNGSDYHSPNGRDEPTNDSK